MSVVTIAGASKLLWLGNQLVAITHTRIYVDVTVVSYPFKLTRITILYNFSVWTCRNYWLEIISRSMPVAYGLKDILDVEGRTHRGSCT